MLRSMFRVRSKHVGRVKAGECHAAAGFLGTAHEIVRGGGALDRAHQKGQQRQEQQEGGAGNTHGHTVSNTVEAC